jgi:hypothetical protein
LPTAAQETVRGAINKVKGEHSVEGSTRYTPPKAKYSDESPPWYPFLVFGLLGLGALIIMSRYVIWDDTNIPVLVGLGVMLGGLWAATRWK